MSDYTWADPLSRIARRHGTDKWGIHFYTPHYHDVFKDRRTDPITLLEIGIGGYDRPTQGGLGLRMWRDYFPNARIVGFDLSAKRLPIPGGVTLVQGDQSNPAHLEELANRFGPFDIVIDDGSHISAHVITSFENLFPHVTSGGWYVVEDTQTSYWPEFQGGPFKGERDTSMGYFKALTDHLNHAEIKARYKEYEPHPFASKIREMRFLHNLVFVRKGDNLDPSAFAGLRGDSSLRDAIADMRRAELETDATVWTAARRLVLDAQCRDPQSALAQDAHNIADRILATPIDERRAYGELIWSLAQVSQAGGQSGLALRLLDCLIETFPNDPSYPDARARLT